MRRIGVVGICLAMLALPAAADGATWGVDATVDTPIGQACPGFTHCSLREAITSTEANPGPDAILVGAGTYPLTNGQLTVTQDLTVARVGAGAATISGSDASRIFDVTGSGTDFVFRFLGLADGRVAGAGPSRGGAIRAGPGTTVSIESSTVSGSDVVADSDARGGAIYSEGNLAIGTASGSTTGSAITGNSATATSNGAVVQGGGVATGGTATLTVGARSTISGNDATGPAVSEVAGGGAYAVDGATVNSTTVAGNDLTGGHAFGGGLAAAAGSASFTRSTVSGNTVTEQDDTVTGGGGGIGVPPTGSANVSLQSSTVAGNSVAAEGSSPTVAKVAGGGVANLRAGGTIDATNSTIAGNSATRVAGSEARAGGVDSASGAITLGATIMAENSQADGASQCGAGAPLTSSGYSVLGDVSSCTYTGGPGDSTGVTDAGLKSLSDYGGLTSTLLPELGSPALDIVPAASALCTTVSTDQRGIARPQNVLCDAGSVEARSATLAITPDPRNFPDTAAGSSVNANVAISNGGDLDMAAAPSPSVSAPFSYVSGCTAPVAAGSNCIMTLAFSPTSSGPFSDTLTVTSGSLSDTSTLNGTGLAGPPTTQIDSGPADGSTSSDNDPAFTYSGQADSPRTIDRFECSLDAVPFSTCPNGGISYPDLADGSHTFSVRAVDSTAAPDASPATRTWTIDTSAPETQIDSGPSAGTTIATNSADFSFHGTAGDTAKLQCSLDGAAFADCTSPKSFNGLADGTHTAAFRAVDASGNTDASPASRSFTVDTTAPDTQIGSGPANGSSTEDVIAAFTYSGAPAGGHYECRLDGASFATCPSSGISYADLADGSHTFGVRAVDGVGNVDASPATRAWTIVPPNTGPSNDFSFGKLKRNKRKGTAKLEILVPGPGALSLEGKNVKRSHKSVAAEGKTKLKIKPRGKLAKKLKRKGKAKVKVAVTYTPTGGTAKTKSKRVKLKRRLPH